MANRWFNSRLPQTLVISQFLLYFDAFWALLAILTTDANLVVGPTATGRIFRMATFAMFIYGAWGIANEKKMGYQVAVAAAFIPLASRVVDTFGAGGPLVNMGYVFLGGGIIGALFEYALIGLLLHTQSREHQKVWFD